MSEENNTKKFGAITSSISSARFSRLLRLWIALSVGFFGVSCSDEEDAGGGMEFQRVALWARVLQEHPDLPYKIEQIAERRGSTERKVVPGLDASITIHSYLGPVTFRASTISAIVTDLNGPSLFKLSAYLKTISERASQLGISSNASPSGRPRVIVLGSNGRIDIQGAANSEKQTVEIFSESLIGETALSVHSFDREPAIDSLLESFAKANQARGPPSTAETVIVLGKLRAVNIEGASGTAEQTISFNHFFNSFAEESATRGMYREAAAVAGAAFAVRKAVSSSTGGSWKSSSGGFRPRRGGR